MKLCSKCKKENDLENQRYCRVWHAEYMREWRKTHPLTPEQKKKSNCRAYANTYLSRGKIKKEPCCLCGSKDAQMHHPDYDKPLWVVWMCRVCHLVEHRRLEKGSPRETIKGEEGEE